ncbi:MASE3 domain-containing protein [Methylogaea oryzae]|uniref:MASE3 domain-containing protein n=1 Tax=Methylogaea oryzae TaxID=1295382 RepID=UPI0006D2756F|nr:MASE3 domain-containing protein [Methylogaea oryzae]
MKKVFQVDWDYGLVIGAALLLLLVDLTQAHTPFEQLVVFLPLHTFMEIFALVVACLIFGVGWHAYSEERSGNTILLACAFLCVGLLDFAHTLSYKGMPDFVTPAGPDKGIFFWLAGRLLGAAALLTVSLYPWRPFRRPQSRYCLLVGFLLFTAAIYWVGLYHPAWIPPMLVEGQGLTPTKIGLEYLVITLLLMAALGFFRTRSAQTETRGLLVAASISVLSELCFTLYVNVSDVFNLLGHIYKVMAYALLYRTIFVGSVRAPFIRLAVSRDEIWQEKERAQITLKSIGDAVITADVDGRVENMNDAAEALTGWTLADGAGRPLEQLFPLADDDVATRENPVKRCLRELRVIAIADNARLGAKSGSIVPVEGSAAPVLDRQGS